MDTERHLHTSDTALHRLWGSVNAKRRAGTTAIKVDAAALEGLLKDHHTLLTALQSRKLLRIEATADQRSLTP